MKNFYNFTLLLNHYNHFKHGYYCVINIALIMQLYAYVQNKIKVK